MLLMFAVFVQYNKTPRSRSILKSQLNILQLWAKMNPISYNIKVECRSRMNMNFHNDSIFPYDPWILAKRAVTLTLIQSVV